MTTMSAAPARAAARDARRWLPAYVALALVWGSGFLFIKVGVGQLPPAYLALGRIALGALTLLALLVVTGDRLPRDRRAWGHLATVALPQERPTRQRLAGLVVGFLGVLVVLGIWRGVHGGSLLGQAMLFAAVTGYGLNFTYIRRFLAGRPESGIALSSGQLLMATLQLAVIAPLVAGAPPVPWRLSPAVLGSMLALGAVGTGVAFALNFHVIQAAGATTASTITYLTPVVSTVGGVLVLHEHLTWNQPLGAVVVLAGVAVSQGALGALRRRVAGGPGD
jgi:drug/metabolite transporter (DMT)-like permease